MDQNELANTRFVIDTMTWSFSRLSSFYNCPHEWFEKYVQSKEGDENFYGEYGSCCHKVLEQYAKGDLSIFEVSQAYEKGFSEIQYDAPPNKYVDLKDSYFEKGLEYFDNIDLNLEDYEILGVEKKVTFTLEGKEFVGYIDLLLKEKETGKIIILDHKSASIKFLKNGGISKKDQAHVRDFIRQLCLYAIPVIEEYGKVDELWWNLYKDRNWYKIPFTDEDLNEAKEWVKTTLKLIENEEEFLSKPEYNYCWNLCSQRNACASKYQPQKKENELYSPDEGWGCNYPELP